MTTSDLPDRPRSLILSLSPEAQWTLHHVLLDRIEREATAAVPTDDEPPPIEVFQAFETLDAGRTRFTIAQVEAIQTVLVEYHHTTGWELERAQIEELLHRVTTHLNQHQASSPSE